MKIISKYKDYYDYISGIYGIDEKIVLDRTSYNIQSPIFYQNSTKNFTLYIAGYIIEGLFLDNTFYYGDDLKQFDIGKNKRRRYYSNNNDKDRDYKKSICIQCDNFEGWIYTVPIKDKKNINIKNNCPAIYRCINIQI